MTTLQLSRWVLVAVCLLLPAPAVAQSRSNVTIQPDRIETGGGIYFEQGSARLRQESFAVLDQVVAALRHPGITLQIQVHTDSRGSGAYNLRMSHARAAAIYEYLVQRGVAAERLTYQGFGETCPVATNQTAQGRQANRRVVFWRTDTGRPSPCPTPSSPPPPDPIDPQQQY